MVSGGGQVHAALLQVQCFVAGAVTALLPYVYSGAITFYCTIFYYFYLGVSFVLGVN